jgi:DNA polymerase I-like protein with 3'-5' exonuclease and polymerase domains
MLLDENNTKGLKDLAVRVLGYDDTIEVEVKSGKNKGQMKKVPREQHQLNAVRRKLGLKKEDGYHLLPRDVLIPYALRDTDFTLQLYEVLMPKLEDKNDEALLQLYRDSMRLKRVLLRMEQDGFALDVPYTAETASEYGVRVMKKWDLVTELVGDPDFNPRSPAQVMAAFERRGIVLEDTQVKTLAKLDDDLARALLEYRSDFKIHTTYLLGLLREQRNGIIHPHFNDDGARTGRMSSSSAKE